MYKMDNKNKFLNGDIPIQKVIKSKLEKDDVAFFEAYKKAVEDEQQESVVDYDPLEKVRVKRLILKRRKLSYAASFAALVIFSLFVYTQKYTPAKNKMQLTQQEIEVLNKESIYALSVFSEKLNEGISRLERVEELGKPFEPFINLSKI